MLQFHTETLTPSAFLPYGTVIAAQSAGVSANQNSATRFNRLAEIKSLRNEAYPNICVFRNTPIKSLPFHIKLLERHPKSTQMFIPMSNVMDSKYLVIVCLNDKESDKPDLNTLKAFVADSKQGINYHVGMWHHPIIGLPLHGSIDFACLVYETGDKDDCEEVFYAEDLLIN